MKNNQLKVSFREKQQEFVDYLRHPTQHSVPLGVKKQRMAMYRQLLFNNVEGFLSGNFPVLRQILTDTEWLALIDDFFAHHTCTTPYFTEIPEEFLDYLQNQYCNENYPFLLELAHYEWVEMALSISKDELLDSVEFDNLLNNSVQLSPLAWPLAYSYPVHKIAPGFLLAVTPEQPTFLVVYRNAQDAVQFSEITPVTYRLLEIIQQNEKVNVASCLQQIANETQANKPELIIQAGLSILTELAAKQVVAISSKI